MPLNILGQMKLSKLYSNKPDLFEPVHFASGLNVVLAEIRLPENRKRDTHNLGKSTLGQLLDFCFLSGKHPSFFLFKYPNLFSEFVFFLEIELFDASYITVRRSVVDASKISFKKHEARHQDFSESALFEWDHTEVPFERARTLLDSFLDWRAFQPWSYRNGLGYLLRQQADFGDVFHLNKSRGPHSDWKPYLGHILGFNAQNIELHYRKEAQLKENLNAEHVIKNELGGSVEDISKIEGLLLLKRKDAEKKQKLLDAFNFKLEDKENTKKLVNTINEKIADLNSERYALSQNRRKIQTSLEDGQILFDPDDAQRLFEEAGVLFQGQIKQDFQKLIAFNKAITEERRTYLQEELIEIDDKVRQINSELNELSKQQSSMLAFLSDTDIFNKYKLSSNELVDLRADIASLERQRSSLHRLQGYRADIRTLSDECNDLQTKIEIDVEQQNAEAGSLFSAVRLFFSEIIEDVIDRKALLSVSPNKEGHLEFKAEILDEAGNATSADLGHTYRKLMCIAFDLAVLRAHLNDQFPRFVYHDGVFESLDDRKKQNLLEVIRKYTDLGIQSIITIIDSDLPHQDDASPVFEPKEIVLVLHDENDQGRLFKMRAW